MNVLYICVSVHMSVNEWLVFGVCMKLQSILVIFIVRLFMYCGVFLSGVYSSLTKFG